MDSTTDTLVHPLRQARRHDREELDETGIDAAAEDRRAAVFACLGDAVATLAEEVAGDELRRGDDVDARAQNSDQLVDVGEHRVVDDAIGLQREQCVDVVGRRHTERFDTAQVADVATDLVGRPRVAPDEFQCSGSGDRPHGALADIAGRPLDDSIRHAVDREPGVNTTGSARYPRVTEFPWNTASTPGASA